MSLYGALTARASSTCILRIAGAQSAALECGLYMKLISYGLLRWRAHPASSISMRAAKGILHPSPGVDESLMHNQLHSFGFPLICFKFWSGFLCKPEGVYPFKYYPLKTIILMLIPSVQKFIFIGRVGCSKVYSLGVQKFTPSQIKLYVFDLAARPWAARKRWFNQRFPSFNVFSRWGSLWRKLRTG